MPKKKHEGHRAVMLNQANLIILAAVEPDAPEDGWFPLQPDSVPKALRDPDIIGEMLRGNICQIPGSDYWFRCHQLPQV